MAERFIRIKTVMDMTGKSRSAIYAEMAAGQFPKQLQISARSVAWTESSINKWIQDKINPPKPKSKAHRELDALIKQSIAAAAKRSDRFELRLEDI